MKSSTILAKSRKTIESIYNPIFEPEIMPNFVKEIIEFGKCIYYLERNPNDKNLIFQTKNLERWNRSKRILDIILGILIENTLNQNNLIEIEFEGDNELTEEVEIEKFRNCDYYSNLLISGGADSICGSHHYAEKFGHPLVFTHIYHRNTPSLKMIKFYVENDLGMPFIKIDGLFKNDANFRGLNSKEKETEMNLSQTRTFYYLCSAVPVNYNYGIDKITISENGPLTINPPFSASYKFTKTTNPEFIDFYNQFLSAYFNESNLIKVYLPFRNYTKAEIMASTPASLLSKTHSCSRKYSAKKSCFNCYACFVRRFSTYSYGNYEDDKYIPETTEFQRYGLGSTKNPFNKDINFFKENKNVMLIKELIDFCHDTLNLNSDTTYNLKFTKVYTMYRELNDYYDDFWDLLKRYAEDILTGIYFYYEENRRLKNDEFFLWNHYSKSINDLTSKGLLDIDFYNKTKRRILDRSSSIVGEMN